MGFNRRKVDDERRREAEKQGAARRALDPQVRADALRLVTEWNERQAQRAPLLVLPTIGAAVAAQHWRLWVRCPGCCTTQSIDLRRLDWHPDAMVTSLVPKLSCRTCRPNAPFSELVKLLPTSIAGDLREDHRRRMLGE
ncbi:MAG: hypothetical protein WBE90_29560 [Xanthobacteraceae bacterium]|jgi:hypothetical protein